MLRKITIAGMSSVSTCRERAAGAGGNCGEGSWSIPYRGSHHGVGSPKRLLRRTGPLAVFTARRSFKLGTTPAQTSFGQSGSDVDEFGELL